MTLPSRREWLVVFGGADRESVVAALRDAAVPIRAIAVPSSRHERLALSIDVLRRLDLPVFEVTKTNLDAQLAPYAGCALLSIGFPYVLPRTVLQRHDLRLNIHPTLLPKYRGPTTAAYVLMNGESESGSTVHLLEDEPDAGDIIAQSLVRLTRFDTVRSLQRKVYASEPALILEAMRRLDAGGATVKQDEQQATSYARKRTPEDSQINPELPLSTLFDAIRACDPVEYPAFFYVDGQKVCIKLWRPHRPAGEADLI